MTDKELIDKIKELTERKIKERKFPEFVTMKELSLIFNIEEISKALASAVKKGLLLEGNTINDKYYLIPKE